MGTQQAATFQHEPHPALSGDQPPDVAGPASSGSPVDLFPLDASLFREILESAPDALVLHERDGRILFANRQVTALFGYDEAELIGRPVEVLLPERFWAVHVHHRARYVAAPQRRPMGAQLELWGRRKDGSEFPVEVSLSPITTANRLLISSSIRDSSLRKQAEAERSLLLAREQAALTALQETAEQLRKLQSVTDSALAHLAPGPLDGELLIRVRTALAADTAAILLLTEDGQALTTAATSGLDAWPEEERSTLVPLGQGIAGRVAASAAPMVVEDIDQVDVVRPALRQSVRSLAAVPLIVHGRVIGVLHAGTVLPRRFTEDDIRLLRLIADRIALAVDHARLYVATEWARAEAEAAVRLRDELLAVISHDAGQPITSLQVATQLLRRTLEEKGIGVGEGEPHPGMLLDTIEEATQQLSGMANELLDLARLQSGTALDLRVQPTDLVAVVSSAVQTAQLGAPGHHIVVDAPAAELVGHWDRERLGRVVRNLLANAVKYSPAGGTIAVTVAVDKDGSARWARLAVADRGIGIPAADLPHVFERFHRGANVVGRFRGTGIGLSGARQIVEQHGGRIVVTSHEGQGTTVTMWLPLD